MRSPGGSSNQKKRQATTYVFEQKFVSTKCRQCLITTYTAAANTEQEEKQMKVQTIEEKTQRYTEYFTEAMKTFPLKTGEKIKQCTNDSLGKRYHNPRWAVSNTGKLYSIQKKGLRVMKPCLCGKTNNEYQTENIFWGKKLKVKISRLMAVYFLNKSVLETDADHPITQNMSQKQREQIFKNHWQVHHKIPFDPTKSFWENDNPDNLQFISKSHHCQLTNLQRHVGAVSRPWSDTETTGDQTLVLSTKGAQIMLQSVVGLPEGVDYDLVSHVLLCCSVEGTDPLQTLQRYFGAQVRLEYSSFPLDGIKINILQNSHKSS